MSKSLTLDKAVSGFVLFKVKITFKPMNER